jgi:hypothetical protein
MKILVIPEELHRRLSITGFGFEIIMINDTRISIEYSTVIIQSMCNAGSEFFSSMLSCFPEVGKRFDAKC